jgi:DNA-binding transcriptional LysR family regulator
MGKPLLLRQRASKHIELTEDGERLIGYARRLVALALEAHSVLCGSDDTGVVKLGVPEDFDVQRLMSLLSGFARDHPQIRLDTVNGVSIDLHAKLESKEIDLALVKRDLKGKPEPALASWPEQLTWVAGQGVAVLDDPLPLAVFPQGCIYRNRIIHALESSGRRWRVAFASQSLVGIQAAVSAGVGISLLPSSAVLPGHRPLSVEEGFAQVPGSELALIAGSRLLPNVQRLLVDYLKREIV